MTKNETLREIQKILNENDPNRMDNYSWTVGEETQESARKRGQKPDLQGVLLACSKRGFLPDGEVSIDQWGQMCAIHDITGERMMDDDISYNLSLPFEDQEETTLTAILELLKK